jgi:hypothetical protein
MAITDAATYGADPANSQIDEMRLLIGDTDCANPCLLDSELQFFVSEAGSTAYGSVLAAEACAAKCASQVDVATGAVRKTLSQKFAQYKLVVKNLKARADEIGGAPVFTALTKSDKRADLLDADLVQPNFRLKQDDNPRKVAADDERLTGLIP